MKINAYTLMEVTIAMLLSAIVLSICFAAFTIIGGYFSSFHKQAESKDFALSLLHGLERDLLKSRIVLKEGDGITMMEDSIQKRYLFKDSSIIRVVENLKADTFYYKIRAVNLLFENTEVVPSDTIDNISFDLFLGKSDIIHYEFTKHYSAFDLYK